MFAKRCRNNAESILPQPEKCSFTRSNQQGGVNEPQERTHNKQSMEIKGDASKP